MLSEAKELVKRMKTTPIDMRIGSVLIIRVSYNPSFTVDLGISVYYEVKYRQTA